MDIWAIGDLHLAFGVPEKKMDIFGPEWVNYSEKIKDQWQHLIAEDDLVLIPGDISWAKTLEEARIDLEWVATLKGTKLMIRGNHDYWWGSITKVRQMLPKGIHVLQNDTFEWKDVSIGGARLWDTDDYSFDPYIERRESAAKPSQEEKPDPEKIFKRELERLEISLRGLNQKSALRIAMTHYPPIGADLKPSKASVLLEKYNVDICVFGHLHSVKKGSHMFGEKNGIEYILTSSDWLNFKPYKLT